MNTSSSPSLGQLCCRISRAFKSLLPELLCFTSSLATSFTKTTLASVLTRTSALIFVLAVALPSANAAPPPGSWTLIASKSDEFNSFDSSKWNLSIFYATSGVFAYKTTNATVSGGKAFITAKKENYNGKAYTAGVFMSKFAVGGDTYTEIRARTIDWRANVCAALWMSDLPVQAKNPNTEIDLQETLDADGQPNRVLTTLHKWPMNPNSHTELASTAFTASVALDADYHNYGVERSDGRLRFYFDGWKYWDVDAAMCPELATQERFVILNIEGHAGNPVDAYLPANLSVEYVRVYKKNVLAGNYRSTNRWTGANMHIENLAAYVQYGAMPAGSWSSHWTLALNGEGYYTIRSRWTGDYMHIENQLGSIQYGPGMAGAWSAQWDIIKNSAGYYTVQNRWTGAYMHIENQTGFIQYALGMTGAFSAQWSFTFAP